MRMFQRFWLAQGTFFGSPWLAIAAWWGIGVAFWSLWRWTATTPLPLVAGLLVTVLLCSPLLRCVFIGLAGHEPTGVRGRAWAVWYLAAQLTRPPLSVLAGLLDTLALVVGPLLLANALLAQHSALVICAATPLLWRVRVVQMLGSPAGNVN